MKNLQNSDFATIKEDELPLISIVMGTYNGSLFLSDQINSIISQSYTNIEIIIIDDCSTDNTFEILKVYQKNNSSIQIFQNTKNLGYIKNFERGCSFATGKLIAFSDQDDYWHVDKLKKLQNSIENSSLIYCNSTLCDESLKPIGVELSDRIKCMDFNNCLQQAIFGRIPGHAMLFKKDLLDRCLPFAEGVNHDWWLSFAATTYEGIKYLPESLVFYRQHTSNLFGAIGTKSKKHKSRIKKNEKVKEFGIIRARIAAFSSFCPNAKNKEKRILNKLSESYQSFSLINNFQRMILFLKYQELLLASKKRSLFRKFLFCLKMFLLIK